MDAATIVAFGSSYYFSSVEEIIMDAAVLTEMVLARLIWVVITVVLIGLFCCFFSPAFAEITIAKSRSIVSVNNEEAGPF